MNYDKQKFDTGPGTEPQRAEAVASRFFDMADKGPGAEDPEVQEMFSSTGREVADGGYDKAQRILESGAQWDDTLRGAASEVNQLDQEKRGAKPISPKEAVGIINRYAAELEEVGLHEDALESQKMAADINKTGPEGVEAVERALQYLEGCQKSQVDRMSQRREFKETDTLQALQERRAARDALHTEKQRRVEQLQQSQHSTEELARDRGETATKLENLFGRASIPEDMPSSQEFLARVQSMSPEELHFLNVALGKVITEFGRSNQNSDLLAARLQEMGSRSWQPEDVARRQRIEDQRRIAELQKELGLPEQQQGEPSVEIEEETAEEVIARKQRLEDFIKRQKQAGGAPQPPVQEAPREAGTPEAAERQPESPEERLKKYQNYEAHSASAQLAVKGLQEAKNDFESSNDTGSALIVLEVSLTSSTLRASGEDIEKLRGQPVNLDKEKEQFGIDDDHLDDYKRMREAQNSLAQGKSVKEVLGDLEEQLGEAYGISQIDLRGVKTAKEAARFHVNMFAEATDDPKLVGQIKEVQSVGYHIPDVPQYDQKGETIIGRFNKDVKARPKVIVYRAK